MKGRRRCQALNERGERCAAPTVLRGYCDMHRHPGKAQEIGRKGGLASAEARRRKREAIRLGKVELAAAKAVGLRELHEAELRLATDEREHRARVAKFNRSMMGWADRYRERVWESLQEERRTLARERKRLEELREEIGSVDAEDWVRRRSELLAREAMA